MSEKYFKTGEDYPCGPCTLPLKCSGCGTIITVDNVNETECLEECEICDYCGIGKCPKCGAHWHCGGCKQIEKKYHNINSFVMFNKI